MKFKLLASVFVFNCYYNGLAQIQSLGRKGVRVYALDTHRSLGTYSRYAKYVKVPDPLNDEDGFIAKLIELAKSLNNKPLLLPTNDHWAETISKHKLLLSQYCIVSASDYNTTELLLDKFAFAKWCITNNYLVPEVYNFSEQSIDSFDYPIAVKAKGRRRAGAADNNKSYAQAADNLRFKICYNKSELLQVIEYAKDQNIPIYAQKIVNGNSSSMRTIGVFAHNGIVKGIVFGKKIKGYPAQYGDCIVGEALEVPDWAKKLIIDICKKLNYTGIAELELMEDSVTGVIYIIEINPRSWSWIGVGPKAGVDLSWIAYKYLVLNTSEEQIIESCKDGKKVIFVKIFEDFLNSIYFYRKEGANYWHMSISEWIKQYKNKSKVVPEFSIDDPVIFIYTFIKFIRRILGILKVKIKRLFY